MFDSIHYLEYHIDNITQIYVFASGIHLNIYEILISGNDNSHIVFEFSNDEWLTQRDQYNYGPYKIGAGKDYMLLYYIHSNSFQFYKMCPFNQHINMLNPTECVNNIHKNEYTLALT